MEFIKTTEQQAAFRLYLRDYRLQKKDARRVWAPDG